MTTRDQPSKTGPKRGDVVLVPFPNSDMRTAKLRPAMIVQANDLATGLSQIILVMVSTNLSRVGHRYRVLIETNSDEGRKSGLLFDSVVMCDNFATVSLTAINRTIGRFEDMTAMDTALRHTLGL